MSTIKDITDDSTFHSHISSLPPSTLAVISFYTPWAAPCKQMQLILKTLAASYPPQSPPIISFVSLDAEALPDISESYDVTAVPFLVLQRDGKIVESVSGSDASKVRDAVERNVGKGGNVGKLGLPPALEATPRQDENQGQKTDKTKNLSSYAPDGNDPSTAPEMSSTEGQKEELNKRLGELVQAAPVMLFMKGTPSTPQCGFSRQLVGLLRDKGVRYGFFNILADDDVRQGLKVWSDWPTFPQLYLKGELVGGLDIVQEELESDPDYFSEFQAAPKGKGGMAAPEAQSGPITPLDVLKIRLQLQIHSLSDRSDAASKARYGTTAMFKNVLRDEGVTAFWKGNLSAELLYVNYSAVQFSIYRLTTEGLRPFQLPNGTEAFASGAVAGASATTITYPLDLLRTRFAGQGPDRVYVNLRDGVRVIWRVEGAKGFFQGLGAGVGQVVPYMGLFFSAYETLRPPLAALSLPFGSGDATAGIVASVMAKTGVFPVDLIRKRLQVQGPTRARYGGGNIPVYGEGVWKTGRSIVRKEGWRGLYRGLGVGLFKSAPASAVTMWTYERALKLMKERNEVF